MILFDKSFITALGISILGHSMLFWQLPGFERMLPMQKVLIPLEIAYCEIKEAPPEPKPEPIVVNPVTYKEVKEEVKEAKKPAEEAEKIPLPEREAEKPDEAVTEALPKEEVEIPDSLPEESEPAYLNYYQAVRERIRLFASYHYRRRFAVGDVRLSFVLSANGYLKELKILEQDSSPNRFLREVAVRSVRSASPFPKFPKELDLPQLSFNVIISFELEE